MSVLPINARSSFVLLCVLLSVPFAVFAQQGKPDTASPNKDKSSNNTAEQHVTVPTETPKAKPLQCTALINQLETRLFQAPNNKQLARAFEQAIQLCQSPQKKSPPSRPAQPITDVALTFGLGHHSNPEFIADYDQIDLDFNGVLLRLDNPGKVKSAITQKVGLALTHKREARSQKRQDEYQLNVSLQRFDRAAVPNRVSVGLRYGAFFKQKVFSVSYQHSQDDQDGLSNNAYGFVQLEGFWAQNNGSLNRLRLGRSFYSQSPVLEGTLLEVQHFFPKTALSAHTNIQPIIGVGGNIQVMERAGGNQWLWQAALGATTTWGANQLNYGAQFGLTQDVKEYSEVLEKNTKRDLLNLNSYLKWRYLGLETLMPDLTVSYVKQLSNIELFNRQFWQIELSVQIKW